MFCDDINTLYGHHVNFINDKANKKLNEIGIEKRNDKFLKHKRMINMLFCYLCL